MTQQRPARAPRRRLRVLAATILALATVAGCGGGNDASGPSGGSTIGANAAAFPVTIPHKFGQATIPAEPRRVVTVGLTDQDAVLALGVVPVGTSEFSGEYPGALWPWAQATRNKLNGALPTVLSATENIDFEQITELRPDLILALYAGLDQTKYDLLSQIAPTVTQPEGVIDYGISWEMQTRITGKALGREDKAEQLIANIEQQIADTKKAHPEFAGKTALTVAWFDDQYYVYSSNDPRGHLLTQLGFTVPAEIDQLAGDEFGSSVSLERSDLLLNVDALAWVYATDEEAEGIRNSPGYAVSKSATEGRDVFIQYLSGTKLDAMGGFITVLSLPPLLEALPAQLSALVDGDSATEPPTPEPVPTG